MLEQIDAAQSRLNHTQEQAREVYSQQQNLAASQPNLQENIQAALLKQQEFLINAKRFHQHLLDAKADLLQLEEQAQTAEPPENMSRQIIQLNQKYRI